MTTPLVLLRPFLLLSLTVVPEFAWAQQEGKPYSATFNVFRPEKQAFAEERLKQLKVPDGFEVSVFGQNLGNVRMMAIGDNGTVYVTCPMEKDVISLREANAEPKVIASDLDGVHGIAIR